MVQRGELEARLVAAMRWLKKHRPAQYKAMAALIEALSDDEQNLRESQK